VRQSRKTIGKRLRVLSTRLAVFLQPSATAETADPMKSAAG
jgi:hypothetical protein